MTNQGQAVKQAALKDIILALHAGLTAEKAKERFEQEVGDVTSSEIAAMEQSLIDEGLSPDEIKKFCNVHALIFESALEKAAVKETSPSHPVYLFKAENREIEKKTAALRNATEKKTITTLLQELRGVIVHYERKEQILFPFLEKKGFMGPSKVMWGKDNEVRDMLKAAIAQADGVKDSDIDDFRKDAIAPLAEEIDSMITKEENILFPAALEKLDSADWVEILRESEEVGYAFIERPPEADKLVAELEKSLVEEASVKGDEITLPTGVLKLAELVPLLNSLPVDITYVGADDTVKYFSQGKERIFTRSRSVIGRNVRNCHPPQSLEIVEKIVNSFKDGSRDSCDFWLNLNGKFIYVRFIALRDAAGKYLGTVEIAQDVTAIRSLEGEKRLLDEKG